MKTSSIYTIQIFIIILSLLSWTPGIGQDTIQDKESEYFKISDVNIPDDVLLEVGGLSFDDEGRLGVTTRRGEMWLISSPASPDASFTRFASGLHEPLGLAYNNGSFYTSQRGELTKLTDIDNDDRADLYENIFTWDLAGNYHEYAYGPLFLENGNMLIWLNLGWIGRGASLSKWGGWVLEVTPEGKMTPYATGMRSPAGLGFNKNGDIFYTENQGDWVGSGRMTHIERGDFAGHPEGLKWAGEKDSPLEITMADITDDTESTLYDFAQTQPALKPPSIWFPHALMGISTSDIAVVPSSWGAFEGQLLVADQGHSKIMRVVQEQIDGVYQGICIPFREGFSSGLLRMKWGNDGTLYCGMTNRGWASTGKKKYGLQRLNWTGKVPFEMESVNIQPDGFTISFTKEVDRRTAANPDSYSITDFNYKYHHLYGSDVIRQEDRTIYKVEVAQDNRSVRLYVEGLRLGFINEIRIEGLRSSDKEKLLHDFGYYTINRIPGQEYEKALIDHSTMGHGDALGFTDREWTKRVTLMPASWVNGPDTELVIKAIPGMLYDKKELRVKAGANVKFTFDNPDDMMHNVIITTNGKANEVALEAIKLGLKGMENGYIPESDDIIAHSTLLRPLSKDVFYFTAPQQKGTLEFVCTFPGHSSIMRGVLIVE
ncbi:MAG: azurin [Saprospiraceae bacterium]|jgi:azurin